MKWTLEWRVDSDLFFSNSDRYGVAMETPESRGEESSYDPVFLHARREAIVILIAWLVCFVWSVTYCTQTGYHLSPEEPLAMLWGMPRWVFIGIVIPWAAADLFAVWFCFFFMVDDDLGEAAEGLDLEEEIAEMHADGTQRPNA